MKKKLIIFGVITSLLAISPVVNATDVMYTLIPKVKSELPKGASDEKTIEKQCTNKIYDINQLRISKAFVQKTKTMNLPIVVYMVIENTGDTDDILLSIKSDIAAVTEIHNTKIDSNGVMSMNPVTQGVTIPAKGKVEFKPKGLHIMLSQFTENFANTDLAHITMTFKNAGTHMIDLPIKDTEFK